MAVRPNAVPGSGLCRSFCLPWLLLASTVALGDESLAPGLILDPPDNLVINYEQLEVLGDKQALVGYVDGAPAYFIGAEAIAKTARSEVLWRRLEAGLRKKSDTHRFAVIATGDFQTRQGGPVWYRVYHYDRNGIAQTQVFYLMKSDHSAFWVYATAVESVNLQSILPLVNTLLRRTTLSEAQK
jgi:hypothetical protein